MSLSLHLVMHIDVVVKLIPNFRMSVKFRALSVFFMRRGIPEVAVVMSP